MLLSPPPIILDSALFLLLDPPIIALFGTHTLPPGVPIVFPLPAPIKALRVKVSFLLLRPHPIVE